MTPQASATPATYTDDFNGDGYRDLVTAAPSATVGGAASGITTTHALGFGPSSAGVSTSGYPRFGAGMLR
ncbi:FG-GAP repeat protein [Streptomyces sp. NPDC001530]|uniref:FG-GAP repeat protein n=1 Tax=Streptomyces sp. NPDC001530 TaxID=3364582 RepID=UPI0036A48AE1